MATNKRGIYSVSLLTKRALQENHLGSVVLNSETPPIKYAPGKNPLLAPARALHFPTQTPHDGAWVLMINA